MSKPTRHLLRVIKGGFEPADEITAARLRGSLRIGDEVFCELKSPRNPRFHRLAYALCSVVAENVEAFQGLDAYRTIKRLQLEANVGCEEIAYRLHGHDVLARIPKSLAFASMSEAQFREVMRGICEHVVRVYWPDCTVAEIEKMAEQHMRVAS